MNVFSLRFKLVFIFLFGWYFAEARNIKTNNVDSLKLLIRNSYKNDLFDNHKDVLRYSTELYYLAQNKQDKASVLFSLIEQSRIYFMENKFDAALKKINEGIALATTLEDYNMLCRFILIYQKLLVQLNYIKESKTMITRCKELNEKVYNKDDKHFNNIYILIAEADEDVDSKGLSNHMNKVISLKKEAYGESLKMDNSNPLKNFTQLFALQSLTWSLALSKRIPEANKYLSIADSLLIKNPNYYFSIDILTTKGAIENIERNHQKAIEYFTQVIDKAERSQALYKIYTVYPMISASYAEKGDFADALHYSWKAKDLGDQLRELRIEGHNVVLINQINEQISNIDMKAAAWNYRAVLLGVLIIAIIVLVIYYKIVPGRSAPLKEVANDPVSPNMSDVSPSAFLPPVSTDPFDGNAYQGSNNAEENKKLVNLAKEDINTFYIEFEKTYSGFHDTLKMKYPELNLSDINFCALIKMKFDIKQISMYTNTTLRSVESRRYRVRKKMGLKGQDDLYIIIANIK